MGLWQGTVSGQVQVARPAGVPPPITGRVVAQSLSCCRLVLRIPSVFSPLKAVCVPSRSLTRRAPQATLRSSSASRFWQGPASTTRGDPSLLHVRAASTPRSLCCVSLHLLHWYEESCPASQLDQAVSLPRALSFPCRTHFVTSRTFRAGSLFSTSFLPFRIIQAAQEAEAAATAAAGRPRTAHSTGKAMRTRTSCRRKSTRESGTQLPRTSKGKGRYTVQEETAEL